MRIDRTVATTGPYLELKLPNVEVIGLLTRA